MANKKESYLCRLDDGTMRTVTAQSHLGAAKLAMSKYSLEKGEYVEVKPRGHGDWQMFKVS